MLFSLKIISKEVWNYFSLLVSLISQHSVRIINSLWPRGFFLLQPPYFHYGQACETSQGILIFLDPTQLILSLN